MSRRLVVDAGGTNVRFALADRDGNIARQQVCQVSDFPRFMDALHTYLASLATAEYPADAAIAAAGPVEDDHIKLTNNQWAIGRAEVSAALAGVPVKLVNDLEAVAAALPHLQANDLEAIGTPVFRRPENRTMLAVNIGTGFGAASAVRHGGEWITFPSEAGHMTLGTLKRGEVDPWPEGSTIESLMSGQGVADLYRWLAAAEGRTAAPVDDAGDVFARVERDPTAAHTLDVLTTMFGRVAGDLALAAAAWGGVYLAGSVALGWAKIADIDRFRTAFERKGEMQAHMQRVPTAAIRRRHAPLFGLARMKIAAKGNGS